MGRALIVCSLVAAACASPNSPQSLTALDEVRKSPAVQEAKRSAPQAYAEAENLTGQARAAWRNGDQPAAEHWEAMATAAYQRAIALARRARAEATAAEAARKVERLRHELAELETEQARLEAEASDLELQSKVIQDAQPLPAIEAASPSRSQARRTAARAWLTEAKLICIAETLVVGERSAATTELIDEITQALGRTAKGDDAKLVEEARRLRSACLRRMTLARRPLTRSAPNAGRADILLSNLSAIPGLHPFRDDRGVVIILGAPALHDDLTPYTRDKLQEVARVVAGTPDFSLLVVWHSSASAEETRTETAILDQAIHILDPGGSKHVVREVLGKDQPLVDPSAPGAKDRNFRMEIVFVTPTVP